MLSKQLHFFGGMKKKGVRHKVKKTCSVRLIPNTLCPIPYALCPPPYTLHLIPYTLYLTPYTLHRSFIYRHQGQNEGKSMIDGNRVFS